MLKTTNMAASWNFGVIFDVILVVTICDIVGPQCPLTSQSVVSHIFCSLFNTVISISVLVSHIYLWFLYPSLHHNTSILHFICHFLLLSSISLPGTLLVRSSETNSVTNLCQHTQCACLQNQIRKLRGQEE